MDSPKIKNDKKANAAYATQLTHRVDIQIAHAG
jgi:hypothetical protein